MAFQKDLYPMRPHPLRIVLILGWIPAFSVATPYNVDHKGSIEVILFTVLISFSAGLSLFVKMSPMFNSGRRGKAIRLSFSGRSGGERSTDDQEHTRMLGDDSDKSPRSVDDGLMAERLVVIRAAKGLLIGICDTMLTGAYCGVFAPFILKRRGPTLAFFVLYFMLSYAIIHAFLALQFFKALPSLTLSAWRARSRNYELVLERCPDCQRIRQMPDTERQDNSVLQGAPSSGLHHDGHASSQQTGQIILVDDSLLPNASFDMDNRLRADEVRTASPEPEPAA